MEITLCEASYVPEGAMRQFEVDGRTVLVCRVEGQVFAVDGICPHRGAQLAGGTLDGTIITCPWHEWTFDCTEGCGVTNPQSQLDRYRAWESEGVIIVELSELEGSSESAVSS